MEEKLINEKIITYKNQSEISNLINSNLKEKYFLIRHSSSENKLFFKKSKTPHIKIDW
jgi:hypothetical protein